MRAAADRATYADDPAALAVAGRLWWRLARDARCRTTRLAALERVEQIAKVAVGG